MLTSDVVHMIRTKIAIVVTAALLIGILQLWCRRPSLHAASFYGSTCHARVYLILGADVNRRKARWLYSTPLDVARTPEMIALLKQHGGKYTKEPNRQLMRGQPQNAPYSGKAAPDGASPPSR